MIRGNSQKVFRRGLVKGWESSQDEIMSNVKVILIHIISHTAVFVNSVFESNAIRHNYIMHYIMIRATKRPRGVWSHQRLGEERKLSPLELQSESNPSNAPSRQLASRAARE